MPIAITDAQQALASSIREWAQRARPVDESRAAEHAPAERGAAWQALAEIGVFGIAAPEQLDGAGGTVADAAAALEEVAAGLAPGPVLPTVLAAALIGRAPDSPVAKELVPALVAGGAHAGVALSGVHPSGVHPSGVHPSSGVHPDARVTEDGGLDVTGDAGLDVTGDAGLDVTGDAGLVLGADSGALLLLSARVHPTGEHRWFVLPADHPGVHLEQGVPVDFSRALARVRLTGAAVPPTAVVTGLDSGAVRDLTATFAAAEAAGIAAWCVRTASSYAGVREQFGRKIGGFQAIKHLCAQMLCRAEQTAALAWDAARAAEEGPEQHSIAAVVAVAVGLDAAVDNAKDCIQVLGGIGYTWEHDAHLYLRRALALRQLLGGSAAWRIRAAELALAGVRRNLQVDVESEAAESVRAEVSAIAALPDGHRRARLAESGYLVPHWPKPYGLNAAPDLQLVIDRELARAGVTRPNLVIGGWAAPTLLEYGTPEQVDRFVGPTLRGEITWCQLFSEPEAGSDLASLRTKAGRVDSGGTPASGGVAGGGGWRLTGQKVWTSLAQFADWAICLARTDPDAPKHKGISYFLVDMRSEGIEIRPLREIAGEERFNEVFLTEVFVPDADVVGAVNDGWRLARTTLANERVAMSGGSSLGEAVERLIALVRERGAAAGLSLEELGRQVCDGAGCSVLDVRSVVRSLGGQDPGPESSVRKLLGVRHRQEVAEVAMSVLGPGGALVTDDARAVQHEFLVSRCLSIAGGTTQVLLNVAGERLLGLPRE